MADRDLETSGDSHDPVEADATRWDRRYAQSTPSVTIDPPGILHLVSDRVSRSTDAVDLACGFGDGGLFLARLGANVTCVDVSRVALESVDRRARAHDVSVQTALVDLAVEPVPLGPWDLVSCVHYLDRDLLSRVHSTLRPGGSLVVAIATTVNLERHARPSARFLLEPGELPSLASTLDVEHHDETWRSNGQHEAWMVATRP